MHTSYIVCILQTVERNCCVESMARRNDERIHRCHQRQYIHECLSLDHITDDNIHHSSPINKFSSYELPPKLPFKSFDDRLIACNGDCGSNLSLIINHIVCNNHQVL